MSIGSLISSLILELMFGKSLIVFTVMYSLISYCCFYVGLRLSSLFFWLSKSNYLKQQQQHIRLLKGDKL